MRSKSVLRSSAGRTLKEAAKRRAAPRALPREAKPASRVWFTSDTHFGHAKILVVVQRPFRTVDEMDEALVGNWNAVVAPGDDVWHLGDFAFQEAGSLEGLRGRLNGKIHLIRGNHDVGVAERQRHLFASVHDIAEIEIDGQMLALCHYPLREWPKAWRGGWHLFGHVHGALDGEPHGHSLDAGVDSHDFAPVDISRIAQLMDGRRSPFTPEKDRRIVPSGAALRQRRSK